jgi:glucose uptake protein GlcU
VTLPSTPAFLAAWSVWSVGAILVFLHANKRGSKHATAWGLGVFLLFAIMLPVYVFHSWRTKPSGPARRY